MNKYACAFLNIVDCLNDNDLSDECRDDLEMLKELIADYIAKPKYIPKHSKPKPCLTEKEQEYLAGVVRPFRELNEITISKIYDFEIEAFRIRIEIENNAEACNIELPAFQATEMYCGLLPEVEYTPTELGL